MSPREAVEVFHLLVLASLGRTLDKRLYAVKGGANLRFFYGSPRLSEDMDIDVETVAPATLRRKVDKLLESRVLEHQLAAKGIRIADWSAPKQTETTQRWKIALHAGLGGTLPTKLEVSRRGLDRGVELGPVDPALVSTYGVSAILAPHYAKRTAFWHKVQALAQRDTTQARDVFDLDLLLRMGTDPGDVPSELAESAAVAAEQALGVSFDAFAGQVLPYLPADEQDAYDRSIWEQAALRVAEALQELQG